MRAAIYARYSSDMQSVHSIEDQLRICRERARAIGAEAVKEYADAAISGSQLMNRPGIVGLLADAKAGRFDVLLAEALDRISRDQEDIAGIFKRLSAAGVRIVTLSEGDISELHIGLKGTMNALFLKDLAAKIKRGQSGRAVAGSAPGGRSYGYRVVREIGPKGELVRGKREIDPDEAEIVREIFAWFAAGDSARTIAGRLNERGTPSPRGGKWNASTINGNKARGYGILNNQLYIGRLTYNRQSYRKDPDTGQRLTRTNAGADRITAEVPDLRILDQTSWDAAQKQMTVLGRVELPLRRRPKHLLSGLLRCGVCGGSYIRVTEAHFGCGTYRESRSCANGRKVIGDKLQARVLDGLQAQLLAPEVVADFVREYHESYARQQSQIQRSQAAGERQLRELSAKIDRIVMAIAEGTDSPALRSSLADLERQRAELTTEQAEIRDPSVIKLHPNLAEIYRQRVSHLAAALDAPEGRTEAIGILRGLINHIEIHPLPERGQFDLVIDGQMAAILAPEASSAVVPERVIAMVPLKGSSRNHPKRKHQIAAWSVRIKL